MTVRDAFIAKSNAELEIKNILSNLMEHTKCKVTGVSITTEEGFGYESEVLTDVKIKLEIQ